MAALLAAIVLGAFLQAADPAKPLVAAGASKDEVIKVYGWPSGQALLGSREILSYPQGDVILENGRVERVAFDMNMRWPAPRPKPPPPTTSTRKPEPAADVTSAPPAEPAVDVPSAPTTEPSPAAVSADAPESTATDTPAPAPTPAESPKPVEGVFVPETSPAAPAIHSAGRAISVALGFGALVAVALLMWLWRRPQRRTEEQREQIAERIDAAAGGMPSDAEIKSWSHEKLRAVTAALAEMDNFVVQLRPFGSEIDFELRRPGDEKPRILVCCSSGQAGVVNTKRLRQLFGSLVAEGVDQAWFVAPAGFAADAPAFADANRIALVGVEGLRNMMREVPPVSLPGILVRE